MKKNWHFARNTALGFYQNENTAQEVLNDLRQKGYKRCLSIHRTSEDKLVINYCMPSKGVIIALSLSIIANLYLFFLLPTLDSIFEAILCILITIASWLIYTTWLHTVNQRILNRFKTCIVQNETLIIAQISNLKVRPVLDILRAVESDHPITFLFRTPALHELKDNLDPLKEPLNGTTLQQMAIDLASSMQTTTLEKTSKHPLKLRLKNKAQILETIRRNLIEAEYIEQTVPLSGSWLLDNDYIIQENIREIERSLPLTYYQKLPKVIDGPMATLPRVYAIAVALINATANRLTKDNILTFLKNYQTVQPLTIGELWALPLMLRLHLIERIQSLAVLFDKRLREGELARYWGNRLLTAARRQPELLDSFLKQLKERKPKPTPHFVEELLEHLFDEDTVIIPLKAWFETIQTSSLKEVIQLEQAQETVNEVAFSSAVISLISLRQLSWREIFENTSEIDAILKNDPSAIYSQMNFATRDSYRHVIEMLCRQSEFSEPNIAKLAIEMAAEGQDEVTKHVGYYLIDEGLPILENLIGFRPTIFQRFRQFLLKYPSTTYLGGITSITLLIELFLYAMATHVYLSVQAGLFLLTLSLFPASEIGVQIMQFFLPWLLPPHVLPKMDFTTGVPAQHKTFIVIPMMLKSKESFQMSLNQLEIHYLANTDPSIKFGLLLDYTDAPMRVMKEDAELFTIAVNGMQTLQNKYGTSKFFLFLRDRVWSESESAWIGWERKRGKLEALNSFLTDLNYPKDILRFGKHEDLNGIRFIITLDADTQLPKDKAVQLIETIVHPLNCARLSKEKTIERGYTIIQPRVSTDISQPCTTLFSKLYADVVGINPYTQSCSDIYQDLMHEGSYHGKCIYDVQAFDQILSNHFPEEHLLSHDLIEGAYVRVAYTSDISLFDSFPQTYQAWVMRQHRWMRGDWQIIDWLFSKVPTFSSKTKAAPPSLINRWKIFDNVRRALTPPAMLCLMISSWAFSTPSNIWNILILSSLCLPILTTILCHPLKYVYDLKATLRRIMASIIKLTISIALLPHQAFLSIDALIRVIYRRCISHRLLLEWSQQQHHLKSKEHRIFICKLCAISIFACCIALFIYKHHPSELVWTLPFSFLWMLAPLIIFILDYPFIQTSLIQAVSPQDKQFLHKTARKTWRYFDDFVGHQSNWLPPDNFQASLKIEVATRTSPTNIGLWMLSVISAYDLNYILIDDALDRLKATFDTLNKLETYQGHLFNWYDTNSLKPLYPRYVSTVDNGNLLSSLWTLQQSITEIIHQPVLPLNALEGLKDIFEVLNDDAKEPLLSESLKKLKAVLSIKAHSSIDIFNLVTQALSIIPDCQKIPQNEETLYWIKAIENQLNQFVACKNRYLQWMEIANEIPYSDLKRIDQRLSDLIEQALIEVPSLYTLASHSLLSKMIPLLEALSNNGHIEKTMMAWANRLKEAMHKASWYAGEKIQIADSIYFESSKLNESTKMQFLYNKERKLFSIGFHVEDCKLDNSFYDLLASEARIASLVSIAKGDVSLEHWWSLGRPYRIIKGKKILVSWGGTMFEYLMPQLYTKYYEDSLIGNACKNALFFQIDYATKRGIPWGISEAAYSEIDAHRIYQYRSFGVPELGFKRDLDKDLVISPYSTALALGIDSNKALKNFKELTTDSHGLYGSHGFYESIDFTRPSGPEGKRGIITYAFMAHHQGMSLLAFNNILNNNIIQERFHRDPRIKGVESLLYEQVPVNPPLSQGHKRESPIPRLSPFSVAPIMGVLNTPHTATPKVNLLGNGSYSVMVTNTGGGYSKWSEFDITRWRSDTTCDALGSYCYVKDLLTGNFWSSTYQPTMTKGQKFSVKFKSDKVEFQRRDHFIETSTEITLSPQDDVEIRLVTIANLSHHLRELELTSYSELSLSPHKADRAHPAFNKLFIQTEVIPELKGIIGFRRLRSETDSPIWAGHLVVSNQPSDKPFQFETDRSLFIGRSGSYSQPQAMKSNLTNSEGYVLDPIFSLRYAVSLEALQRVQVAFITLVAKDRETLISLMKKYTDISNCHLAFEMAWTHSQLDLRHLKIHQEEAQLFQKLSSHILFPHSQLRVSQPSLQKNRLNQSTLWQYSISGDIPIIAISIADIHEIDLVKQILTAHAFWRMRGLKTDLVILNEEAESYEHPLYEQLLRVVHAQPYGTEIGKQGGVFLLNADQIPDQNVLLILSIASVHLVAARGFLRQHLASPIEPTHYPSRLVINKKIQEYPSNPLPFLELPYFNGLGGFTPDGREYVIYLGPGVNTPAPWINVIANPQFGTIVTESGLGTTWYGNSQTNRLTPWSNDPLLNPICDTLYIRDDQKGTFWTPTPSPIRELDPYRVRHGQGYTHFEHNSHGIEQNLVVFVPTDDSNGLPVRIQKLTLLNRSSYKRLLSVYSYSELVLGTNKEETQMHVNTAWDVDSQGLIAWNNYNCDYKNFTFICSSERVHSFTGNRTEFIGRNHHTANPFALKRKSLSGQTGAGFDPCAAIQVTIELQPGEQKEIIFALGVAPDLEAARQLMGLCKDANFVNNAYLKTLATWDQLLGTTQIECPDLFVNFAFNRWLLYQNLSCRLWGRSGFYQSSGAFGFRDQLQDVMALLYTAPEMARQQIIKTAAQQFIEGDVQHWWLPPLNNGVRTRISDDLLWLPFVTAQYVRVTNDTSILSEMIPFIEGDLLKPDQHETFFIPKISNEKATLLEHCKRAIYKGATAGSHGIPLIGGGDWNDGMNLVGIQGKGESIWLGWFLIHVLHDFAELLSMSGDSSSGAELMTQAHTLSKHIEEHGWDGSWYLRAYMDDGTPLGSKKNQEDMIDSLPQSWAVISGAADPDRALLSMRAVEEHLILQQEKLVLLLTLPFDKTPLNPGYIKGYPPGVRENGGQYTHGSLWVPLAFARLKDGDKAAAILKMMHPVMHTQDIDNVNRYKIEPYVTAGDVYGLPGKLGRGGWSWYTGSGAWMYRIWLEEIFGFCLRGNMLELKPVFPSSWETATLTYKYMSSTYIISYENKHHAETASLKIVLDNEMMSDTSIKLVDDHATHQIHVIITSLR